MNKELEIIKLRWPKLAENLQFITNHHDLVGVADRYVVELIYKSGNRQTITYNDNFELVEKMNELEKSA
jgi:hypothetical protein